LDGSERFTITGIADGLEPRELLTVRAERENGQTIEFQAIARLDTEMEIDYSRHGGILPYVLRRLIRAEA